MPPGLISRMSIDADSVLLYTLTSRFTATSITSPTENGKLSGDIPNFNAQKSLPSFESFSLMCLPPERGKTAAILQSVTAKSGVGLASPYGSSILSDFATSTLSTVGFTRQSILTVGKFSGFAAAYAFISRLKASISSSLTVKPAASSCPPNFLSRWLHDDSAS